MLQKGQCMAWIIGGAVYVALLAFLLRFFAAVKRWDERIHEMVTCHFEKEREETARTVEDAATFTPLCRGGQDLPGRRPDH